VSTKKTLGKEVFAECRRVSDLTLGKAVFAECFFFASVDSLILLPSARKKNTWQRVWHSAKIYFPVVMRASDGFLSLIFKVLGVFVSFLSGLKTATTTATIEPFKELTMSLVFSFKRKSKTLLI
jgi:hypothetical protein